MRAVYINTKPSALEYYFACERCSAGSDKHRVEMYFNSCMFDMDRYDVKTLLGTKGWIDSNLFGRIMRTRDFNAFRHNAINLMHRLTTSNSHTQSLQSS